MDKWTELKQALNDIQPENTHYSRVKGLIRVGDGLRETADKWDELCDCLKWGRGTPTETILLWIHAINTGNQQKKTFLDSLSDAVKAWDLGGGDVDVLLRVREVLSDAGYKFQSCE